MCLIRNCQIGIAAGTAFNFYWHRIVVVQQQNMFQTLVGPFCPNIESLGSKRIKYEQVDI